MLSFATFASDFLSGSFVGACKSSVLITWHFVSPPFYDVVQKLVLIILEKISHNKTANTNGRLSETIGKSISASQ
jgi:hypothetical protein